MTRIKGSSFINTLEHMIVNIYSSKRDFINVTRCRIWKIRNIRKHEDRAVDLLFFALLITKEQLNIEHFTGFIHLHKRQDSETFTQSWAHNDVLEFFVP